MAAKKTPIFDFDKGEFKKDARGRVITVTDAAALEQVAIKAYGTPRGVYLIYADPDNPEANHKYGSDTFEVLLSADLTDDARESELKRAVRDALVYDPWITDVIDINLYRDTAGGTTVVYADFTLVTVFDTKEIKGAVISG